MKNILHIVVLVCVAGFIPFYTVHAQAEDPSPCYFDEYTNNRSIQNAEKIIQNGVEARMTDFPGRTSEDDIRTIPVVVHILHIDGPENISDEQVESQIRIMNEDYGKLSGTNGDGDGVDTRVRFCLAKIDPTGNCTNGIVRVYSSLTNHRTYERASLKKLSFWDNTRYMNIYLVKSITGGTLGYSSFPGGPPDEDGMVVRSNVFGDIGTASSSLGRTASHEIGHWFGLYHTFNNGCGDDICLDGDYVCDTPPQASPSFSCATLNTCSNDDPDLSDLKENYMNYTPDACKNMFTEGQMMRIQTTLDSFRMQISSPENLIATGCDSAYIAPDICGVAANFVSLTKDICMGTSVEFMDVSLNNATTWQWTFEGGNPDTSSLQNPIVSYENLGSYPVKLVVTNGESMDSISIEEYIVVSEPGIGRELGIFEDFESGIFPPQDIVIFNPDEGVTWGLDSAASVSGDYSIKIDNYINTNYGSSDEIILPYLNLTTHDEPTLFMSFSWAYARSDPSFSDEMIVLLSTDCGSNFNRVYYRTGNNLTTGPTQTTPFIPNSSQWRTASVVLTPYLDEQYVQIKIVNITDGGNNLYIDNIKIGEVVSSVENIEGEDLFHFYPNPATDNVILEFSDSKSQRTVTIFNAVGQPVLEENVGGNISANISTSSLAAGVYYLQVKQNGDRSTQVLVITK